MPESQRVAVKLKVNGKAYSATVEPRLLLVELLRDEFDLTGTHVGCDTTYCGACTVLFNGVTVKSCTMFAVQADGSSVTTIEGLAPEGQLHPVQQGFWEEHGLQCGYCTPGMIMGAYAFLLKNPKATRAAIIKEMDQHLCRCGAHVRIVEAIQTAANVKGGSR